MSPIRYRMRSRAVVLLGAVSLLASCVPPEPTSLLARKYGRETTMGEIQRAGILRVGLPPVRPWTVLDGTGAPIGGFAFDHARYLAEILDVRPTFTVDAGHSLLSHLEAGELDIAFPPFGMTEQMIRANQYSDVYYVAHQRLLAPPGQDSVADMSGRRVCSLVRRTTEVEVHRLNPDAQVVEGECGLDFDMASGLDIRLMELREELEETCRPDLRSSPAAPADEGTVEPFDIAPHICGPRGEVLLQIQGEGSSTEGLAAAVIPGSEDWVPFVNDVLTELRRDGTWTDLYERWLSPHLGAPPEPPVMTAREAAALHPRRP